MMPGKSQKRPFARPFLALVGIGSLGALALLPSANETLSKIPPDQIAATGGETAVKAALLVQPVILVMAASALGLMLAHRVGLRSWIVGRLSGERIALPSVLGPLLVGCAVGTLVIGADMLFAWANPTVFSSLQAAEMDPRVALAQGVLYGGLTEEILVRWGLLSTIAWALTAMRIRLNVATGIAVTLAALLFAAGHLPALAALGEPHPLVIARTLLLNSVAGLAFGALFIRQSLEAAMVGHMAAHVVFFIARLLGLN
jgi:hypothetical protein